MSATALRKPMLECRFLAEDFALLVRGRRWIVVRGEAVRLH